MNRYLILNALLFAMACSPEVNRSSLFEPVPAIAHLPTSADGSQSLVPGEAYFSTLMEILSRPLSEFDSIDVLHFNFFTEKGHTREIADRLIAIKRQQPSLKIRIVLEGAKDADRPLGAATRNILTGQYFAESGISVSFISGLRQGEIEGVTHAKAIRIGNYLLSGSTNLTNTSLDKNNEINLLVHSENLAKSFERYVGDLIEDSTQLRAVTVEDQGLSMITDNLFLERAVSLIQGAVSGDALDFTTYFFAYRNETDVDAKKIFDNILAAKERGVKVRIYLERSSNPAINQSITTSNLKVAKQFADAGITSIYLDPLEKISHAKIIRVTGPSHQAALIGSTNIYRGDFDENHQVNFLITDSVLVKALNAFLTQRFAYEGTKFANLEGSAPPQMFRFWRGYKQPDVDAAEFRDKLNRVLIPELDAIGSGKGLSSYLPVLMPHDKQAVIPDEVAMIQYASEEMYDAIRSTVRGEKYGPMHFSPGLFARERDGFKSSSLVAEKWQGSTATNRAYILNGENTNWQKGRTIFRSIVKPESMSAEQFTSAADSHLRQFTFSTEPGAIASAVVLVDQLYIMEFVHFNAGPPSSSQPLPGFNSAEGTWTEIQLPGLTPENMTLDYGHGGSMVFNPAIQQ